MFIQSIVDYLLFCAVCESWKTTKMEIKHFFLNIVCSTSLETIFQLDPSRYVEGFKVLRFEVILLTGREMVMNLKSPPKHSQEEQNEHLFYLPTK